jgi:His/Glu/Gln/Arg/opine family amino acid ABC transporter permease subunit
MGRWSKRLQVSELFDVFLTIAHRGLFYTAVVSVGAWLLALLVGIPLGIAGEHRRRVVREGQFLTCSFLRSVPEILAIYMLYYGLSTYGFQVSALVASVVALGLVQAGFVGEALRGCLLLVEPRQREAASSFGLNRYQLYRYVILPQVVTPFIPAALNVLIGTLKLSSIASAVALGELMHAGRAQIEITHQVMPAVISLAAIYLLMTLPIGRLVASIERRSGRGLRPSLHALSFSRRS